jgi:hypothetical protein
MTRQKKIEIAFEAFLIIAALIVLIPLLSAVHKADHGATEVPLNQRHELNIWQSTLLIRPAFYEEAAGKRPLQRSADKSLRAARVEVTR